MKNKKMDSSQNQSYDLISFLWKNKMPLIIVGLISLLSSSIISFMIEEKFESTAALYPTKTSSVSISRNISEDQSISKFDLLKYLKIKVFQNLVRMKRQSKCFKFLSLALLE